MKPIKILLIICALFTLAKAQHDETQIDFYDQLSIELETRLNEKVNYLSLVNVDSAKVDFASSYFFSDPYGTLKDCILFGVNTYDKKNDMGKNYFGVYKDSKIIYITSSVVNSYLNQEIMGTEDLNNDGKIEIIYALLDGNNWGLQFIWIASWDGNKLEFLNEINPKQESNSEIRIIDPTFEIIDIEGDGILEITGQDDLTPNYKMYKWNGTKYVLASSDFKVGLLPRDKVDVELNCKVKKADVGFNYSYSVYNKPNSIQMIGNFGIVNCLAKERIENLTSPIKWIVNVDRYNYMRGLAFSLDSPEMLCIKRGESKTILTYTVKSTLPTICKAYVQGQNGGMYLKDISQNSYQTYSIGPKEIPDTLSDINYLDSLKTYCDSSYSFGWIKDETIKNKYENYLNSAKINLEKEEGTKAKGLLKNLLRDLEADSLNYLTDEAYALLRYNTEYLLDKIKEGGKN